MQRSSRLATTLSLLSASLAATAFGQNLVVDGDLEGHTASGCTYNNTIAQFNGFYTNVHSFGQSSGIDIMQGACFGSPAQSGLTRLALAWNNAATGDKDAMALDLTAPLTPGATYDLSFWAELLPFGTSPQPFEIGVSGSSSSFGTLVFSATPGAGWTNFMTSFAAPSAATHLTVRMPAGADSWHAFDNFDLQLGAGGSTMVLACDPAINHSGGTYVTLANSDFSGPGVAHLEATGGPAGEFGYFLVSGVLNDPGSSVGNGMLCLGIPIGRYAPAAGGALNSVGQFDAAGVLQNLAGTSASGSGYDVLATLPSPPGGAIATGDTWHFQCWYRDGNRSNFSNVVSATF